VIAGLCGNKVLSQFYFEGHTDTDLFCAWLKKVLIPKIRTGQTIIMDNTSFHKSKKIKRIIKKMHVEISSHILPGFKSNRTLLGMDEKIFKKLWNKISDFYKRLNYVLKLEYGSILN
jgi:transposase